MQFWLISPKFGCHGNSLGSMENLRSIFEFTHMVNPTIHAKDSSISCTELKFVQFLGYVCLNLVAMATSLAPLKFQIAHWN